jgi:hypothetical protein
MSNFELQIFLVAIPLENMSGRISLRGNILVAFPKRKMCWSHFLKRICLVANPVRENVLVAFLLDKMSCLNSFRRKCVGRISFRGKCLVAFPVEENVWVAFPKENMF